MMQSFTPLPFGGAVLLDTATLAIAECDEAEADLVSRGLEGSAEDDVQRMMTRLHDAGWRPIVPYRR